MSTVPFLANGQSIIRRVIFLKHKILSDILQEISPVSSLLFLTYQGTQQPTEKSLGRNYKNGRKLAEENNLSPRSVGCREKVSNEPSWSVYAGRISPSKTALSTMSNTKQLKASGYFSSAKGAGREVAVPYTKKTSDTFPQCRKRNSNGWKKFFHTFLHEYQLHFSAIQKARNQEKLWPSFDISLCPESLWNNDLKTQTRKKKDSQKREIIWDTSPWFNAWNILDLI